MTIDSGRSFNSWDEAARDEALARGTGVLWLTSRDWIHRRVDTISFHNDASVRRTTSLDLTIPRSAPAVSVGGVAYHVLPLALLAKRPLIGFDLAAADGSALSVLTTRQNGQLASEMMAVWAGELLDGEPSQRLRSELDRVILGKPAADEAVIRTGNGPRAESEAGRLADHPTWSWMLHNLARSFLMAVPVHADQGGRMVLKFGHDAPWSRTSGPVRQIARRVGWAPDSWETPLDFLTDASSYHIEVVAPEGVSVSATHVLLNLQADDVQPPVETRSAPPRTHTHIPTAPSGTTGSVNFDLRPDRAWVGRATAVSMLVTAMLIALALGVNQLLPTGNTATSPAASLVAAVVLAGAGAAIAVLSVPEQHALAVRLLSGLRITSSLSTVAPFAAAIALVLAPPERLGALLAALAAINGVAAVLLLVAWILASRSSTPPVEYVRE